MSSAKVTGGIKTDLITSESKILYPVVSKLVAEYTESYFEKDLIEKLVRDFLNYQGCGILSKTGGKSGSNPYGLLLYRFYSNKDDYKDYPLSFDLKEIEKYGWNLPNVNNQHNNINSLLSLINNYPVTSPDIRRIVIFLPLCSEHTIRVTRKEINKIPNKVEKLVEVEAKSPMNGKYFTFRDIALPICSYEQRDYFLFNESRSIKEYRLENDVLYLTMSTSIKKGVIRLLRK